MPTRKLHWTPDQALLVAVILLSSCTSSAPPATVTLHSPTPTPRPSPSPTPTLDPSLIDSARDAIKGRDTGAASSLAQAILDADPLNVEALLVLSAAQYIEGQYSPALETLQHADPSAITDTRVLEALLDAYVSLSRATFDPNVIRQALGAAQGVADELSQQVPHLADLPFAAVLLLSSPNYANEISVSEEALGYFQKAEEAYSLGDYDKAIAQYEAAIEEEPDFQLAQIYYADALFAKGDYPGAESVLSSALQRDPRLIQGWQFLGHTYENMGLWRHAKISYLSALMLDPDDEFAQAGLARLSEAYSSWVSDYLSDYAITVVLPPNLRAQEVEHGDLGPAAADHGGFIFEANDGSAVITFDWQPLDPTHSDGFVPELLADVIHSLPGATPQSDVQAFTYSSFPIWYQDFLYAPPEEPNPNVSFAASWACEGTLYQLQLALPGDDFIPLRTARNTILDPITCPAG